MTPGPVLLPRAERGRGRRSGSRATTSSSPTSGGWWCDRCSPRPTTRSAGSSGIEAGAAVRQRGRRAAAASTSRTIPAPGFATADPFLETNNLAGRQLRAAVRGAGVRQLAVRVRRPVLRPPLPARVRPDDGRLDVLPGHGRLPALRQDRRARSCWPRARCTSAGSGGTRSQFRIFARKHRPASAATPPAPTGGTSASTPTIANTETGCAALDRLVGTQIGRRQRRDPLPDPQPVVRAARRGPADRGRAVLRHRPGLGRAQHAQVEPRGGRRPDPGADAAADDRRLASGPTCSASPWLGWTIRFRRSGGRSRGSGPSASDRRSKRDGGEDGEAG